MFKTTLSVIISIAILLCVFAGGFVTGCLARGGEADGERLAREKLERDIQRLEITIKDYERLLGDREKILSSQRKDIASLRREIAELGKICAELGRIKREVDGAIKKGSSACGAIQRGIEELETRFNKLQK